MEQDKTLPLLKSGYSFFVKYAWFILLVLLIFTGPQGRTEHLARQTPPSTVHHRSPTYMTSDPMLSLEVSGEKIVELNVGQLLER